VGVQNSRCYEDRLDFGLIADRELVPDLWHLVDLHIAEIERMFEVTGAQWAVPQTPPPMRYGGDGVEPIEPSSEEVRQRVKATRELLGTSVAATKNENGDFLDTQQTIVGNHPRTP
jgi:hypothetical protein